MEIFRDPLAMEQQMMNQQPPVQPFMPAQDPRAFATPEISMESSDGSSGFHFTVIDENTGGNEMVIIDNTVPQEEKKRRGRPPKNKSSEIVRPSSNDTEVIESTSYSYAETTDMLRETLAQIDGLNSELVQEFTNVKNNKYIKNKYNTIIGLTENIGSLLNTKISAIREINSSISKANDLDYKKMKDINAMQAEINDDQYVADMYKSFISNPQVQQLQPQFTPVDQQAFGSGIIRADIRGGDPAQGGTVDAGYLNYLSNISPEQNMMRYENDPNVKQVVVWDKKTNAKFFQVMNMATGEVIPNVPTYDQMFMEDVTIDVANNIAKNLNLRETFPLVIINDNVTAEY